MKIYSLPTLLVCLLAGLPAAVFYASRGLRGSGADLIWAAVFIYILIKGLYASLTKEGYENSLARTGRMKRIYRERFGFFAPLAPYVPIIILGAVYALLRISPDSPAARAAVWVLLAAAVIYAVWLRIWLSARLREEDENRDENRDES